MENRKTSVFGIYSGTMEAERAVGSLAQAGFSNNDISVLLPDRQGTKEFAHERHTKAPEGTTAGAASGGILGGALGLLAGIGALAIPGAGPFIAAGPIMAALAGLGVGGAVGGLIGALIGLGIPEYEATRYEGRLKAGGVLLSVHCDTREEITRAKDVLGPHRCDGHRVGRRVERDRRAEDAGLQVRKAVTGDWRLRSHQSPAGLESVR